jgi:post-segregation antitoxin (ccd killing protein)
MLKKLISIRINPKIHEKAKEMGLNISKTCEKCLKQEIQRQKAPNCPSNCISTSVRTSQQHGEVGLPGFEPGSREPKSRSLDHASRQPQSTFKALFSLIKFELAQSKGCRRLSRVSRC